MNPERLKSRLDEAQRKFIEAQIDLANVQSSNNAELIGLKERAVDDARKSRDALKSQQDEALMYRSRKRDLQERIDALQQEQLNRHRGAQNDLWGFQFENAGRGTQQQMARHGFFEAHNRFEGAESDDDRERALRDMQRMHGKMDKDKEEMPEWSGLIRSTAGAIESGSLQAQELQERVMNDFNRNMLDNSNKMVIIQKAMEEALKQMVIHTDPSNQSYIGGTV